MMTKFILKSVSLAVVCLLTHLACNAQNGLGTKKNMGRPNILFIAIDDLRPEIGAYGSEIAITPNLDTLASEGILFERAYCQEAICSPSRASLMTGARPETIGVIENYTYFRDINPDIVTLPQHFWNNGYETVYCGKIYHGKFTDDEKSWSRKPATEKVPFEKPNLPGGYALAENQRIFKDNQKEVKKKYPNIDHYALGRGPAFECADVSDQTYIDGYNTDLAIATMKDMVANGDKPFFLGLGFKLPHLDWKAPKKYWDLYHRDRIPLTTYPAPPVDGASTGLHASFELRVRHGIPKSGPIGDELAKTLKHAYLASVSYVDAQIGRMLTALEEAGLRENTIIVVWSDHGWHLGDMGIWGKATNYEVATRVPLIVNSPNIPQKNRGTKSNALVELVDLYPTLCDLAGLPKPEHLEGFSFSPLLHTPDREWKKAVFSQYPNPALREWAANPLTKEMRETYFGPLIDRVEKRIKDQMHQQWDRQMFENDLMGYSMRTQKYRLVAWKNKNQLSDPPLFIELYDLEKDPTEVLNIAKKHPQLVKKLLNQLNAGWQQSLP
ncbi:sulfatase [Pseudozobellia thermophila]|uniref:Arylsulfatase A n=1 Tax=Pseudozobellia thermophila TaxID=192903 RepID=A0A1M6GNC2_9FLAO|nr:sulfatase [Pseudozobellia thermophila]SHJ11429.1 Arylsulfatase A [Pseudozobellia thermophila]